MTESDDQREKAINRLDEKLQAFEAKRAPAVSKKTLVKSTRSGSSEGYRLLAEHA